jgi:bacterial/archaeal transporter family protein
MNGDMSPQPWLVYALLSAAAAALVAIFAKVGMKDVDPTLATATRSVVMTVFLLAVCTVADVWRELPSIPGRAFAMIALSGLAGAVSWMFYFKAIKAGAVCQVAPIDKLSMPLAVLLAVLLLGERPGAMNRLGIVLIVAGTYLAARPGVP